MLVLSRKKDEKILIGDPFNPAEKITLTVVEIRGDKVRIGIEAPRDVDIHREEIWLRIHDAGDGCEPSVGCESASEEVTTPEEPMPAA